MNVAAERAANPFANAAVVATPTGASATALVHREAQDIQAAMLVARNFRRDVVKAVDGVINAFSRPTLCEKAMYAYARGGQEISDLNIRAAEELARQWGNIRCGVAELTRGTGQSECMAYAQDLETGFYDEKRFFVRHWRDTKKGGHAVTEERDVYELIANMGARRKRACILAVIPGDVQEAAKNQIAITLKQRAEVTPERIKSMLEKFGEYGVTQEHIEKRIQRRIESMLPAQMLTLGRIYNSLEDNMSTPDAWFEIEPQPAATEPAATSQTDAVKQKLKAGKQQGKAAPAEPEGKIPHFDKDTAITAIKNTGALKQLSEVYEHIVMDFADTNRVLPVEVEGAFGDKKAALEQAQE